MTMTFDEAVQQVTAPGGPFEITEIEVDGHRVNAFLHAPPSVPAVLAGARARGDRPFLVYEDETWTFADVMAHVDGLGAALVERHGIARGDRVGIAMRNYPEWIVAYAAVLSVGGVAVLFNAWWTTDELEYGIGHSGARVVIADAERIERMRPLLEGEDPIRVVGVRLPEGGATPPGVDRYEDVVVPGAPLPEVEIGPDDDATILYTSGTTGRPKGAVSTHRAVTNALMGYACRAGVDRLRMGKQANPLESTSGTPPAFILVVPLFHVTGCIPVMLSCFASGTKLVMMYKWNPERALELIERERVTTFVGVPTMSWDLLESPDFAARDTSSLTNVSGGGAPAPPELVKRVAAGFERGRPGIGYGMTETNAYGPQNGGDDYLTRPTSAGRTVPIMQMRVVDEAGEPVPVGAVGEIEFRGPNMIRGYWNDPAATEEAFHDGWLRSGDLGRLDEEGFVYVEDRAKDMVLRGGENIYCAEVEAVIYEHPAVYEAAVFGLPHDRLGEELAAAIVLRAGATLTVEELQAHVGSKLAGFKVPTVITFSEQALPRGATGKILKRELRDELAAGA
ncbi:MAG: acyl--CoA ligase [Acidimicrobiales bacterium]|nr:acyl--CoA ligase [Acidimicrobiales bacterium]